ncbi:unnamed protein product [Oreochromis niloticus]|nr:unnamed protein product [Mustela putorius furo]
MSFDMDDFAQQPSIEKLERCTKADLLLVANLFNVDVPLNSKKAEIKQCLVDKLVDRGVFGRMKTSPGGSGSLETAVGAEAAGAVPKPSKGRMTSGAEAPVAVQSPTFDPISQVAAGLVTEDLKLALRLKEVELEAKAKEVELMHLRIRAMELDLSRARDATPVPVSTLLDTSTVDQFNASKQIVLVPPFREGEVDSYFTAFERIATTLKWPKDVWSLLLQCKLVGRAQEVCASLSIADSLDYEVVKATILRAYELVPEAYRQKFRACSKSDRQTFVEFAREKAVLFDKWLAASKVKNFTELKELILLEEFKTCLPESIVVYLNEQKVELLSKAAVLADEFVLTHRASLSTARRECVSPTQHAKSYRVSPKRQTRSAAIPVSDRKCFYCHEIGHLVAACPSLQRKEQAHTVRKPKGVGFVRSTSSSTSPDNEVRSDSLDDSYRPFVSEGFVSLNGKEEDRVPITILRDTGAAQTLILRGILPFSDFSFCGSDALVWGVKMDVLRVPLHKVFLQSPLVSGPVTVGVRDYLPVPGVAMILGNDLANGKVFFTPRVVENPVPDTLISDPAAERSHSVFPACAVTRAHKRRYGDVDFSDSFLCAGGEPESESKTCDPLMGDSEAMLSVSPSVTSQLPSGVNKKDFVLAQHSDPTLAKFSGPYTVQAKLSDTDYVIDTPERRKKCRVCHINMMKPYFAGGVSTVATVGVPGLEARYDPVNDDLVFGCAEGCARLRNSEILSDLRSHLTDLDDDVQDDVCQLIENHLDLFSDTPSCTTVLEHDIDVGGHPPIKQHAYRVNPTKRALFQTENSNQRLMRWSLLVQDFNLDIRHKKGTENVLADALSRTFL